MCVALVLQEEAAALETANVRAILESGWQFEHMPDSQKSITNFGALPNRL
jgi:hypothetical protein